jgi:ATP-dependent DNA helicase RecG
LKKRYDSDFPDIHAEQLRLLQNLNLAAGDGNLNLAGVLLFAEQPELIFPQFVAKGVRFPGIAVHADSYDDTEDFEGPLSRLFKDALAFVMRNLHKVQGKNGVNSPGTPEITGTGF